MEMTAKEWAVWFASFIASPLTQLIKNRLGWTGWKALYLFFAVSFVLSFFALYLKTEISIPAFREDPVATIEGLLAAFVQVMGLATVIYKIFIDKPGEGS
jgi:hypothetical protein